ncbi:hypothetical protein MSG28_002594 [Choristoneura fumiferana]|uniref:Uncharacterized protein n=1 Tax=Choristoneura fumiferana TaxID=7141 RepID=A0ACC0JIB9_CHOFU|nr:hypothetical protein MSG28_002594 [Choristoneura fumiferana]
MLQLLIPLLLPILATATIQIDIQASDTYSDTRIQISGSSESVVTEKDRELFKIRDWELKQAAYMYSGGRPDDVYVKSPTPLEWGDLYSKLDWPEVTRTIIPKYAKILDINTNSVIVARKHFKNRSQWPSVYGGKLSQQADMTVKNTWITGGSYNFGEQVSYSISIGSGSIGKSRSVYFSNWFGYGHETSSGISIGSDISVQPTLQPGQEVNVVLTATRGVVRVEVTYEATLSGLVGVNYSGKYKGHHFWGYDVNGCLKAVGKPRKITFKEVIEIGFYFNEDVTSS